MPDRHQLTTDHRLLTAPIPKNTSAVAASDRLEALVGAGHERQQGDRTAGKERAERAKRRFPRHAQHLRLAVLLGHHGIDPALRGWP